MVDTPFINDGADESLRKTVSLLNKIEAKTGSTTITGPVTVSNEVEVKNDSGNPVPVKVKDSAGADVSYITSGTAGTPSASVLSVQGISGGVSLPISGTVTANGGDFTAGIGDSDPARSVQIGFREINGTGDFVRVDNDGRQFPVKAYGASNIGNSIAIPVAVGNEGNTPSTGVPIAWSDDESPDTRIAGTTYPLPIQAPNGIAISGTVTDVNIGQTSDSVATTDTGTFSVIALIKRGLQNWTSLLAKIPALVSGRIPVDGSGVTQPISASSLPLPSGASTAAKQPALGTAGTPSSDVITVQGTSAGTALNTKETQPTDDYVINTSAFANFSPVGSLLTSAAFDAGASADYVVITLEGGGSSGAFYYDLSILNTGLWDSGNAVYFSTYYDIPASTATDAYSYRSVSTTSLFGGTRSAFNGRFIVPLTQSTPYAGTSTTYRYIRLNCPASYGGWRYRFTSYKSVNPLLANSIPGNASTTRVNGRVDVGYVSNLPTLSATVTQATNANLKGQAQILNSAGSLITYAESGTYGNPSVDVISVQNPQGTSPAITTFTSTTASSTLVTATTARKTLTIYNSGAGDLYISPIATCTTTNFQVKLASGDYWECPAQQVTLGHTAVYGTAGTAYVTTIS